MEEEYFFYYLTHGSSNHPNAKKWDHNEANDEDQIDQGHYPDSVLMINKDTETTPMMPPPPTPIHQQQIIKIHNDDKSNFNYISQGLHGFDSSQNKPHPDSSNYQDCNSAPSYSSGTIASMGSASRHQQQQDNIEDSSTTTGLSLETNNNNNERVMLLPPMNGTVDYSNLKGSMHGGSIHSTSVHGLTTGVNINGSMLSLDGSSYHGSTTNGIGTGAGSGSKAITPSFNPMLERGDSFFKPLSRKNSSFFEPLSRRASSFVEPFNDHKGKPKSVVAGIFNLTMVGIIIGIIMPQNERLPTPWYRLCSSIIGYSYFIFWCASFWPQVVMNFQRKSTEGLSIDYSVVNFFGYICYTTYTCMFFWNKALRKMYFERHEHDNADGTPPEITVESNDVAFAIHALIMSIIWLFQLQIYGGFEKCRKRGKRIVSKPMTTLIVLIVGSCSIYAVLIFYSNLSNNIITKLHIDKFMSWLNWLDYLYFVAYMKVLITTAKYIPQVILNMKRKSCVGWNIWNILLDISGGIFSLAQLIGDAIDLNDLSSIKGNSAKLGLSAVSIFFDIIFLLQHYVWYPEKDDSHDNDAKPKTPTRIPEKYAAIV